VFLTADAARAGRDALACSLRRRSLGVGVVTGGLVLVALVPIRQDAPTLAEGLATRAAPLVVLSAIAGILTLVLLWRRRYSPARVSAVVAVGSVVAGWGVGQYPWLLVDEVTITEAAGADATLAALLVAVALAVVIVLPALTYLYRLTQSEEWAAR
jgi:cytochrome d ubiquinol oxidase subunit II